MSELKTKKKAPKYKKRHHGATFLLPSPSAPRPRRWAGRYARFPRELKHAFNPVILPHLHRLKKGEIGEIGAYVPKVGLLRLKYRNGRLWGVFIDEVEYAKLKLKFLREEAVAVRYGMRIKSPQGGYWTLLPQQRILPVDFEVLLPNVALNLFEFSILWFDITNDAFNEEPLKVVKPSNLWLTPSVPCAVRAPTCTLPLAER